MSHFSTRAGLAFPASLSEKYRPHSLQDFVGLDKPKKVLQKFAENPFPNAAFLFVGPSGTGKTSAALALCEMIRGELHHIPSQNYNVATVEEVTRMCHYVPRNNTLHVVLVDEADVMTPQAQLSFLSKLDGTAFPPQTIFIFTANDTERLERRFLSRCKVLEFSSYGLAEQIAGYLDKVWHEEGGNGNAPDLVRLAKDSRNNARDCLMRLEVELMAL